jgi:thioredoxin 1
MLEVNGSNFEQEVLKSDKLVVVEFGAAWCPPCRQLLPILERMSKTLENVKFVKVNIDNDPDLCVKYKVEAVPKMIFVKDGKIVNQTVGMLNEGAIKEIIDKA